MPTYDYECEKCHETFEADQKITDPKLMSCPLPDSRTLEERFIEFNSAGGAVSWNRRPFSVHPDRCKCQGDDPTPHRHYERDAGHPCARCSKCEAYKPAIELSCGGPVKRLISGPASFVLKGGGWAKDGY